MVRVIGNDAMENPASRRAESQKTLVDNQVGPGRKSIFPSGTALSRLQFAIPETQMEKLRLLAAFRNTHQAVVLAELIDEGWDNHHLEWMNQDLIQSPLAQSQSGESGREGKDLQDSTQPCDRDNHGGMEGSTF
jgi:hypothetical protein